MGYLDIEFWMSLFAWGLGYIALNEGITAIREVISLSRRLPLLPFQSQE